MKNIPGQAGALAGSCCGWSGLNRVLIVLALLMPVHCAAADRVSDALSRLPQPAAKLLDEDAVTRMQPFGKNKDLLKTRLVDVRGMPFRRALQIETTGTAKYYTDVSLAAKLSAPIRKGDVIFLSLYMKCPENRNDIGKGILGVSVGSYAGGYTLRDEFTASEQWVRRYARGEAMADSPPGKAVLRLVAGYRPQKVLIGGIELLNYGRKIKLEALPVIPATYEGIEPDAPWRRAAQERIEKYRKSGITVKVTGAAGKPVQGATVTVSLKNHAFGFGGPYPARLQADRSFRNELPIFQKYFKEFFNKAVIPNALKWKQYDEVKKKWAEEAYAWLSANHIPVRGHNVIWPGWNFLPRFLRQYENDRARIRRLTMERIDHVMGDWKGRLAEWDVTNECWRQDDLMKICGWDIVPEWFRRARQADPGARLYYNDANTLANNQPGHRDHYFRTIQWLLEQGAPVDGMGFQCHTHTLVPPEVIYQRIERFATLGPEIEITEFDIQAPNISGEVMAQYTRDFMTIVFSHPKTVGIITWIAGNPLREARSEPLKAQAAFFHRDWTIKPNGQAWLDMKTRIWNTNVTGKTGAAGTFTTRGFHGDYDITVSKDAVTRRVTATLGKGGKTVEVTLQR